MYSTLIRRQKFTCLENIVLINESLTYLAQSLFEITTTNMTRIFKENFLIQISHYYWKFFLSNSKILSGIFFIVIGQFAMIKKIRIPDSTLVEYWLVVVLWTPNWHLFMLTCSWDSSCCSFYIHNTYKIEFQAKYPKILWGQIEEEGGC